jgi:hypothetical protein
LVGSTTANGPKFTAAVKNHLYSSGLLTTSYPSEGSAGELLLKYEQFIDAYGHSAGEKYMETFRVFKKRVAEDYTPEAIIEGARKYRVASHIAGSENQTKWKYPIKWLKDNDHFPAYVRRGKGQPCTTGRRRTPRPSRPTIARAPRL